ncbi:MAG TPA: NTP transferase domain-containing protein [Actinomycetota bacterium]|nr:NTP transferase domain-containing protein [Actinomycetota bacterium]
MAGVRAVVLAAGRGVRMGGGLVPKTLLPMGDEEPLLSYILRGLQGAGIDDLMIVTGHGRSHVEEYVNEHWRGDKPVFVFNARYASWGNFHSVRVALDQSPGLDVLVVNSDVVVAPEVYERVAATDGDLVLAVQKRTRLDEEDMRVQLDGHVVRGIGKALPMGLSHGEYAGVSLLRPDAARAYLTAATDAEWRSTTHVYYEDVYATMIPLVRVTAAFVRDGEYAEVDEPSNVPDAIKVIATHQGAWTASA